MKSNIRELIKHSELIWVIFIIIATILVHMTGSFWVGFLSDDYDLLQMAPSVPIFSPLEGHHFSPIITALFKLASARYFPPIAWHSLSLTAHILNTLLVFLLARSVLNIDRWSTLVVTGTFALSAAGYEALAWACSIGYVILMPFILLSLIVTLSVRRERLWIAALLLALLQLCALLIWDWGILLLPMACICAFLWLIPRKEISLQKAVILLIPCAIVLCLILVIKHSLGYKAGYHTVFHEVLNGIKMLAAAPITNMVPNISLTFLKSLLGILFAGLIWLLFVLYAIKYPLTRFALFLYLVCILPVVAFGALQSRYSYIATPFIGIVCVSILQRISAKTFRYTAFVLVIAVQLLFAIERSQLWLGAYNSASSVKDSIISISNVDNRDLVIVNLPDAYGPPGMIWRPFMWRNGVSSFGKPFTRVNTPDCSFIWRDGPIPMMTREKIALTYGNANIYEVRLIDPYDFRQFVVLPFDSTRSIVIPEL